MKIKSIMEMGKLGQEILRTVLLKKDKVLYHLKNQKHNAEHLKLLNKELRMKNQKLQSKLKKMRLKKIIMSKSMPNTKNYPNGNSIASNGTKGIEEIKKKYPNLPENQIERIEIERTIARHLIGKNSGCFYVSQVLKTIENLYSIDSNERVTMLTEIKSWIERDSLCRVVKTIDKVNHYTFI